MNMTQGRLWDFTSPDFPPCQRHSEPSRAAAEAIAPKVNQLQAEVLAFIRAAPDGCIDHEIAAGLGWLPETALVRRIELVKKGLVKDGGRKRASPSGHQATVWEAV